MAAKNRSNRNQPRETRDADFDDSLKVLTARPSWRLSRVSALVGFEYTEVKLKQYAAVVRQELGRTVSEQKQIRFTVQFNVEEHLKLHESNPDAIMIVVHTRDMSDENSIDRLAYEGVIMSWGEITIKIPNTTHLPYYFDRGPINIMKTVRDTITRMFDCSIFELKFAQNELCLLAFTLADIMPNKNSKNITFNHVLINSEKKKSSFMLQSNIESVLRIWQYNVGNETSHKIKLKAALTTYQMLLNQFFHSLGFDLSTLNFVEVLLPEAGIKTDGQVKMKTSSVVVTILNLLNEYLIKPNSENLFYNNVLELPER